MYVKNTSFSNIFSIADSFFSIKTYILKDHSRTFSMFTNIIKFVQDITQVGLETPKKRIVLEENTQTV